MTLKTLRSIFMLLTIKKESLMLYIFIPKKFMLFNACFKGRLYINIDVIFILAYLSYLLVGDLEMGFLLLLRGCLRFKDLFC